MNIVCLDLEGVLVPEIWIAFAEETGIPELKRTTRDEPDYDKLMNYRINILKEHGLGLKEIQETIAKIDPMPGAKEFLDELREITQVIIISDTFTQFAGPLMKKLGYPTIFCNSLEVAEDGEVTGFKMRIENSKLTTVKALQSARSNIICLYPFHKCKECFLSKGQGDVDWSEANKHRVKLIFVPYTVILFYMVQSCSGLNWKKITSVPYMKILARMVQIFSDLSWDKLIFVPYMRFLAHMVQICSDLRLNKLVFVLYMKFVARMVQICSDLRLNKLVFVPYVKFLACMVQISSALSRNKLISVPYLKFLVRMVQPYLTEYENSVLCGSYILV